MKKAGIAATALVVLAAAGTAGAWYTGTQLQGVLQQNIELANQQLSGQLPDAGLALELVGFEQGVFSSQARYRLVLEAAQGEEPGHDVFVSDQIEHGPWPLSRLISFKWWPVMAVSHAQLEASDALAGLFAASAGRPPIILNSSIGYGREIHGDLALAPMVWDTDAGLTGTFSGLSAVYKTDTAGAAIKLNGRVDSLELQGSARGNGPAIISLVGMDFNLDRERDASGLYLGTGTLELDQLAAVIDDQPALVFSAIQQSDTATLDAEGANMALNYRVGSVSYGGNKLGSLDMDWTLSRFDPQATMELAGMYNSAVLGHEVADPQAMVSQFEAALERLLDGSPRLSLDNLSIKTPNGESRFSLGVGLERPMSLHLPAAMLVPQLIGTLEAKLVLSKPMLMDMVRHQALFQPDADAAMVEQEAAMMAEMVASMAQMMQVARVEGDNILSQLSYAGGAVKLNGQSIELEELVALLSGMQAMQ